MKASEASSAAILDPARDFVTIRERMERAPQIVQDRLNRRGEGAGKGRSSVPVVGGNAVGYSVGTHGSGGDESDSRCGFDGRAHSMGRSLPGDRRGRIRSPACQRGGYVSRPARAEEGDSRSACDFAGERVNEKHEFPNPTLGNVTRFGEVLVLALPELVRMKLTSWRLKTRCSSRI